MAITTVDGIVAGLQVPQTFFKVGATMEAIGVMHSLFYTTGMPGAAAAPTPGLAVTGTLAITTDDVTLAGEGKVWVKGPLAVTTDDVTLAAAGTVSSGGGSVTGTLAFTTGDVTLHAESQNIPPPSAFTVALDYRRPSVLQPVVRMPRVAGGPLGPRMRAAWWRR